MTLTLNAVSYATGGRKLIDEISLTVQPGTLHVLLGPNGAGKSTLLSLLAGDLKPLAGQATLDDRRPADWPAAALARRRAVMMQRDELRFPFSVDEVVSLGRTALPVQRR